MAVLKSVLDKKKPLAILTFTIVYTLSGCAITRQWVAESEYIDSALEDHVFQQPCTEVWLAARAVLFGNDYQIRMSDRAALVVETEWKKDDLGEHRVLFQGYEPAEYTCRVKALQAREIASGDIRVDRDTTMEWKLLQEVDPPTAHLVRAGARQAGQEAR